MKKCKIGTVAAIAVYAMILTSCFQEDVCTYNGNQIVEKADGISGRWFRLRKEGQITPRVYVVEYDWNRFNVGDTLYCHK